MFDQIQLWASQIIESQLSSPLLLIAVFVLGITAALGSCCNVGVIGMVAGYSGSQDSSVKPKSLMSTALFFFLGNIISLSIIGALTGLVSQALGATVGSYWKIIGGMAAIYFGLAALGWLPFKIPQINIAKQKVSTHKTNGLLFGLALGGFATSCSACCNPIFPIILGMSFIQGSLLWSWLILLVFAIGYSLPLGSLLIGLGMGLNKVSNTLTKYSGVIKYASGGLLILMGFALLVGIA